jgi:deazaflavin-dependent oxidoreductase (nitroreductase family)
MDEAQQRVINEFRANGGKVGGFFEDIPLLLITTTGAKSGQPRTTALSYVADGERYIIAAAAGGAARHPDWYYNLVAHPDLTVEVGTEKFEATAVVTTGAERTALYDQVVAQRPRLADYQAKTTRQIPLITLNRRD